MQVFGATGRSTAFMLHAFNQNGGTLKRYDSEIIATNMYDKEFKLNVIHDTSSHMITVLINDQKKLSVKDNGVSQLGFYYFKTGVYAQGGASSFMQAKVRNISLWQK